MAKEYKKRLEEMILEGYDDADSTYNYEEDEDAPRYYWAGDDANEIIFYDEEE